MRAFDYHAPETIPAALDLFSQLGDEATILAGGTDLLLRMKAGELRTTGVVSLRRIADLKKLEFSPETGRRLGASVTLRELTRSPLIHRHYPCLAQTAGIMASEQIRSRATVGGNLCNAAPSADLAPPLLALSARALIIGLEGERQVALEEFFIGPGETCLKPGELLRAVLLPTPRGQTTYLKLTPRAFMDPAVVGVAVSLRQTNGDFENARIALGGVAPTPMRALQAEEELSGSDIKIEKIETASAVAAQECFPIDDVRATAWYRRRMVKVLVRRACLALVETGSGRMRS